MLPLPMNEFVQQALAECFFDVELDVIEWNTLFTNWRKGAKDASARGAHATNVTYAAMDPFFAMIRFLDRRWRRRSPTTGASSTIPKFDKLVAEVRVAFDPAGARQGAGRAARAPRSTRRRSSGSRTTSGRAR